MRYTGLGMTPVYFAFAHNAHIQSQANILGAALHDPSLGFHC